MKSRFLADIKVFEPNQGKRVTKSRKMTPRPKTLILWPFSLILSKNLDFKIKVFGHFSRPRAPMLKSRKKAPQIKEFGKYQGFWPKSRKTDNIKVFWQNHMKRPLVAQLNYLLIFDDFCLSPINKHK